MITLTKQKLLILHTGGTISMKADDRIGAIVSTESNPLLNFRIPYQEEIELVIEDIFHLPSPAITLENMLELKHRIEHGVHHESVTSVVITHGTDTLEETAYFLNVTIGNLVPIIITGAMRSSNEIGSDGFYNFQSAIRVALSDQNRGKGVLVVMNDEIHPARYVTKTHTTNVATFDSPTSGPIGLITKEKVLFIQELTQQQYLNVNQINGTVPIVKAYAGMATNLLTLIDNPKIDGLVIEALGAGNLPPQTLPALQRLLDNDIPIMLVSRCFNGIAEGVYHYEGGGHQLQEMGVMFGLGLNGQKARIKLLIALNANLSNEEFRRFLMDAN